MYYQDLLSWYQIYKALISSIMAFVHVHRRLWSRRNHIRRLRVMRVPGRVLAPMIYIYILIIKLHYDIMIYRYIQSSININNTIIDNDYIQYIVIYNDLLFGVVLYHWYWFQLPGVVGLGPAALWPGEWPSRTLEAGRHQQQPSVAGVALCGSGPETPWF